MNNPGRLDIKPLFNFQRLMNFAKLALRAVDTPLAAPRRKTCKSFWTRFNPLTADLS